MVVIEEEPIEKVKTAKKIVVNLQSEDKKHRKDAFVELARFLFDEKNGFTQDDYHVVFNEVQIYALNGFRDRSEQVRSEAIKFVRCFLIEYLTQNDYYLSYVVPVLLERIGSCEIVEESEEIRLELVLFLQAIICRYTIYV